MTLTLDHPGPPEAEPRVTVTREDAMKYYATGHTAAGLRLLALDTDLVEAIAFAAKSAPEPVRATALAFADAIDLVVAEGLTPEKCYVILGLADLLGRPFVPAQRAASDGTPAAPQAAR